MVKTVFLCLITLTAWGLLVGSLVGGLDLPVVYMTYPAMECVTVQGGESDESCDNTPPRFEVVYVDPKWAGFTSGRE